MTILDIEITVFTPTFNRAYILTQLYESLRKQTLYSFEWLIIDDGSTDETENLIKKWMKEDNKFCIRYYKKGNGGKCRAINCALDYAQGRLFFIVDSDDYLIDDAIEKILKWEGNLSPNVKFCGVSGNLGISKSFTLNTIFNSEYYDGTLLDRYRNIDGERAFVFYTKIHKKYKYPEYDNEKFMTEAVVYNRMANDGYKMRYYNDIICVYKYQEDGLTKAGNSLFINNPRGYGLWLREKDIFMKTKFSERLKTYYNYSSELYGKYGIKIIAECINISPFFIILMVVFHKFVAKIKCGFNVLKRRNND